VQRPLDHLVKLDSCILVNRFTKLIECANVSPSVHPKQCALEPAIGRNREDSVDNMYAGRDSRCLADHRRKLFVAQMMRRRDANRIIEGVRLERHLRGIHDIKTAIEIAARFLDVVRIDVDPSVIACEKWPGRPDAAANFKDASTRILRNVLANKGPISANGREAKKLRQAISASALLQLMEGSKHRSRATGIGIEHEIRLLREAHVCYSFEGSSRRPPTALLECKHGHASCARFSRLISILILHMINEG
jgi:hypothetical protein